MSKLLLVSSHWMTEYVLHLPKKVRSATQIVFNLFSYFSLLKKILCLFHGGAERFVRLKAPHLYILFHMICSILWKTVMCDG